MQKQKFFIKAETILKYIITDDDETDTLITAKSSEIDLVTSDYDVHRALACVQDEDTLNIHKLKKLFGVVEVVSYAQTMKQKKPELKEIDIQNTRKIVLGGQNDRKRNNN